MATRIEMATEYFNTLLFTGFEFKDAIKYTTLVHSLTHDEVNVIVEEYRAND
jgi:hypothetical protein